MNQTEKEMKKTTLHENARNGKATEPVNISQKGPDPNAILNVAMGFWQSKTLLAAVKLGVFTFLNQGPHSARQIQAGLKLDGKYIFDFLDTLSSMGFLQREGLGENAVYSNTVDTAFFLDKQKEHYIGGFLEMANDREYKFWGDLEEGLRTGKPQNEIKYTGKESFAAIYADADRLSQFTDAMSAMQKGSFAAFTEKFDFSPYKTLLDAGGSAGLFSSMVAAKNPHMLCTSFDLPQLAPFVEKTRAEWNVAHRVSIQKGSFFEEDLPKADVVTMNNILNSFDLPQKKMLIKKAYNALPENGCLAVVEAFLDNERIQNGFALLMSLNMLIESDGGFSYTENQFKEWAEEAGFKKIKFMHLAGPGSAAIAYK